MPTMIGHVTEERYQQLVTEGRALVETQTRTQFRLGDIALEIEPMQPHGGSHPDQGEEPFGVSVSLQLYADELGIPISTVKTYRWVCSRWPAAHRKSGVPYTIHKTLASIPDQDERYARIADPPLDKRTGTPRWTETTAKQVLDHRVTHASVQQKIDRIHDLARDEEVAAVVATDLLRRPDVAFRAMGDQTARHLVNRAQIDRSQQAGQVARRQTPAAPVIRRLEHSLGFVDLIGVCATFVASAGRVVPSLRGLEFTADERATVHTNIARVRSTADWIETAVETGSVSMDQGLARLLRGE